MRYLYICKGLRRHKLDLGNLKFKPLIAIYHKIFTCKINWATNSTSITRSDRSVDKRRYNSGENVLVTIYRGGASLAGSKGLAEGAGINLRAVAAAGAAPPLSLAPLLPWTAVSPLDLRGTYFNLFCSPATCSGRGCCARAAVHGRRRYAVSAK